MVVDDTGSDGHGSTRLVLNSAGEEQAAGEGPPGDALLVKPFRKGQLVRSVRRLLDARRGTAFRQA